FEPHVDFGPRVDWRKKLHRQVWRSAKETWRRGFPAGQALLGNERDIRRSAVAILHPEAGAGVEDYSEPVVLGVVAQSQKKAGGDISVLKVVFGAHDQFSIDHFVNETVLRQSFQFSLGPDFRWCFGRSVHTAMLA